MQTRSYGWLNMAKKIKLARLHYIAGHHIGKFTEQLVNEYMIKSHIRFYQQL